nr:pentapeptide repeat-containing protein [Candidatus Sigynarchaeota archaeon]
MNAHKIPRMDPVTKPDLNAIHEHFPLSSEPGAIVKDIDESLMHYIASGHKPVTLEKWNSNLRDHELFLNSGGSGGIWQTFSTSGLVIGVYLKVKGLKGKQADFMEEKLTSNLPLKGAKLRYANLLGVVAEGLDFEGADLTGSLITDALLAKSSFKKAILQKVDLSRSDLQGCIFQGADLREADLENCNLEGADFTDTILTGSRFPGANLKDVVF